MFVYYMGNVLLIPKGMSYPESLWKGIILRQTMVPWCIDLELDVFWQWRISTLTFCNVELSTEIWWIKLPKLEVSLWMQKVSIKSRCGNFLQSNHSALLTILYQTSRRGSDENTSRPGVCSLTPQGRSVRSSNSTILFECLTSTKSLLYSMISN